MKTKTTLDLHNEHLLWKSELAMWLQDLDAWDKQMHKLREDLRIIDQAVKGHLSDYDSHQLAIREHELRINKHELDLALLDESNAINQQLAADHELEAQRHLAQKEAHEHLKRYHYIIAGLINGFKRSLEDGMV